MTEIKVSLNYEGQTAEFVINTDKDVTAELLKREIQEWIGTRPNRKKR